MSQERNPIEGKNQLKGLCHCCKQGALAKIKIKSQGVRRCRMRYRNPGYEKMEIINFENPRKYGGVIFSHVSLYGNK